MPDIFYVDTLNGLRISYSQLIDDLNKIKSFNPYCHQQDYYSIFKSLLISLLIDEPIYLLDSDLSQAEIQHVIETDKIDTAYIIEVSIDKICDQTELYSRINKVKNWQVYLCTSGTTGLPKMISHNFNSITRMVKRSSKHSQDIWGLAYNPTHIAGIQVFFQAFLNSNALVRLFNLSNDVIIKSIINEKLSHISATPTYYRLLFPINKIIPGVRRITSGGEKLDLITTQKLKDVFINATFMNVYASTEAGSVLASENDIFTIENEHIGLFKILNQELYISPELMGKSSSFNLKEDWFATGDLVEVISEKPFCFRFVSRKNEIINVGGYNVNPHEVEEILRSIETIKDARVYPKKSSVLDNIVCADIVSSDKSLTIPEIYKILRSRLQEYKIPRIISYVETIQLTRTGKQNRS